MSVSETHECSDEEDMSEPTDASGQNISLVRQCKIETEFYTDRTTFEEYGDSLVRVESTSNEGVWFDGGEIKGIYESPWEIAWIDDSLILTRTGLDAEQSEDDSLSFDEYQEFTEETAVYPSYFALPYLALGVAGESGEVTEHVKKYIRDNDETKLEELKGELGDVLWYVARLADELDVSFESVAKGNVAKLIDRKEREVLHGSGDAR